MKRDENDKIHIQATIVVERIAKRNHYWERRQNAEINGTKARLDIEHLLTIKVYLELWVKSSKRLARQTNLPDRDYGYRNDDYRSSLKQDQS